MSQQVSVRLQVSRPSDDTRGKEEETGNTQGPFLRTGSSSFARVMAAMLRLFNKLGKKEILSTVIK